MLASVATPTNMALAEIYSSPRLGDCEQRAFILRAVGIEHAVLAHDDLFGLLVPEESVQTAIGHLRSYDEERRAAELPAPAPLINLYPHAAIGALLYVIVVIAIAYLAGSSAFNVDWLDAGALTSTARHQGQWWRAITALTLHADLGHMLGNLAFGVPFSYFAAQLFGVGRAWASIVLAAFLANLLDSSLMPAQQETIGASTAVFAMLGLVAAYAWRTSPRLLRGQTQRWALRLAPLTAGIALLGITGAGGEQTDVVAHLAGFGAGALLGIAHAHLPTRWLDRPAGQMLAGIATLTAVVIAWSTALFAAT
jgi:rhomboid protease GluP